MILYKERKLMKYVFNVIEKNEDTYKVGAKIILNEEIIFQSILIAKYDKNRGMVYLDLMKIKKLIGDESIRVSFISALKMFIKSY